MSGSGDLLMAEMQRSVDAPVTQGVPLSELAPAPTDDAAPPDMATGDALAAQAANAPRPPAAPPELTDGPPPATVIPIGPYKPEFKPGQLTATPREATSGLLGVNEALRSSEREAGDANAQAYQDISAAHAAEADRLKAQADAEARAQQEAQTQIAEAHQRHVEAYQEYSKKSGSLKDPTSQYWEDRGVGSRILAGVAAFASGGAAGLSHEAGNPFLDFINKQIQGDYEAHKQNISDLYDKQVAAGKLEDTAENRAAFDRKARFAHYDLASQAIGETLASISNGALGQNVKALTGRAVGDLNKQSIAYMQQQAMQEQVALQAKYAAQAAQDAADRKAYLELYGKQPEAASDQAKVEGTVGALSGLPGVQPRNVAPGARVVASGGLSSSPYVKPEQAKDIESRMVDGHLARSKEDADAYITMKGATDAIEKHVNRIEHIENLLKEAHAGDNIGELRGEYERAVVDLDGEIAASELASKRVPHAVGVKSFADAGLPQPPASWADFSAIQLPSRVAANKGRIKDLRDTIQNNRKNLGNYLTDMPAAQPPRKVTVADLPDVR